MTIDCPICGDPLTTRGVCGSCGYGRKRKTADTTGHSDGDHWAVLAAQAKEMYLANPPTSFDLTDQQWYNVCKFWPNVAAHCKRPRPVVGPEHPLDATSRQGPLMRYTVPPVPRRGDDPDALDERAALQSEGV